MREAGRIARSAQSGLGRATWAQHHNLMARSTKISESFDAWLRPSRTSQPNTRTTSKYSRRTGSPEGLHVMWLIMQIVKAARYLRLPPQKWPPRQDLSDGARSGRMMRRYEFSHGLGRRV